ncbi:tRNA (adenosine(37)-N6)-threonylcarbamoyltransferase complex dimerization subunit type 1 TsaB [Radiobacillus sp. PE A8.2]|uniref:tRNA (adenosine(37)-N6)-threonylcarbamoyltransferase complex dimerization subunit type 1 TsaB n=1 Tax=Radiobacillus sp. PE A8.2 TaxID=3380349 RepID=UPI0038902907
MNILAIDTSNQVLGIAITRDGELVGELITNVKRNHSVRLMPAINQLMKETNVRPEDLNKIVVAKGPGSYTGVRIGLSTAKTMAWALQIPVVGVSSLELLAYQGVLSNSLVCPFFDARRGLVYTGLYQADAKGKLELVEKETNVLFQEWLIKLRDRQQHVLFFSPDMAIHQSAIEETMGMSAIIDPINQISRPSVLAYIGGNKQPDELHKLTPNYLRLAEAEAKWMEQQGKE